MRYYMTGKRRISAVESSLGFPRKLFFAAVFSCAVFLLGCGPLSAVAAQRGPAIAFLPDATAAMGIEHASSPEKAGDYQVYVPSFMAFSRLPGDFNGAVWLRLTLRQDFKRPDGPLRVNFGSSLPGVTKLFIPGNDGGFAMLETTPPAGVFTLSETTPLPETFYARIDGAPGLWFRPVLESGDANVAFPVHLVLCGVFAFAMLLLLIQYIRKAEEWRVWAAITAGCGIVAAILPAIPAAGSAFALPMALAMLMPGLILMCFAHTARHIFDTPKTMPGYDKLLVLYYVLGGLIALVPFIPGFLWTTRCLPLAGVVFPPLLLVAVGALNRSLKGAGAFFCAVFLLIAGSSASAWELTATKTVLFGESGLLWGLAVGALLLAFSGPTRATTAEDAHTEDDVFASLDRNEPETTAFAAAPFVDATSPEALHTEHGAQDISPMPAPSAAAEDDEDFPLMQPDYPEEPESPSLGEAFPPHPETPATSAPVGPASAPAFAAPAAVAPAAADSILGAPSPVVAAPAAPVEAPVAPQTEAETVSVAASALSAFESATQQEPAPISLLDEEPLPAEEPAELPAPQPFFTPAAFSLPEEGYPRRIFDLPLLVKNAYDDAAKLAEEKNIGMSWFIAPQTGRLFEGEADLLDAALRLLLRDMVEAGDKGNVRLNVRRLPDSKDAGHLVFTVVEWDANQTYHARNMAGLAEAWALAEKSGGIFSVEHSPSSGTTVIFSSIFAPKDKKNTEEETAPAATRPATDAASPADSAELRETSGVHLFEDYPDVVAPADAVVPSPPIVSGGLDGDELAEETDSGRDPARIILADTAASSRAKTAAAFKNTAYSVLECTSPPEAHTLYTRHPSALILMNADMPEVDIAAAIKDMHALDAEHDRSLVPVVALVEHEAQGNRMMAAGCARAILKPADPEYLLAAANDLAPLQRAAACSAPSPEAVLNAALGDIPPLEQKTAAAPAKEAPTTEGIFSSILPDTEPEAPVAPQQMPETKTDAAPRKPASVQPQTAAMRPQKAKAPASLTVTVGKPKPAPVAEETPQNKTTPETVEANEPVPAPAPVSGSEPAPAADPEPTKKSSGMGLLDMIVTDMETAASETVAPEPEPAPETPVKAPRPVLAPPKRTSIAASGASSPKRNTAVVTVRPQSGTNAPAPQPSIKQADAQAETPDTETATSPVRETAPATPAFVAAPTSAPQSPMPAGLAETPGSIQLPGEEDSVFRDMLPLAPGLIHELTDAMADAMRGKEEKSPMSVQEAAERIAGKAESFGLVKLERMARCVERAAAADDIEPMECVLSDLEAWVARYKEALAQLHRESF